MIKVLNDPQLTKNFKLSEMVCHDGNNEVILRLDGVGMLQAMRDSLGVPITVVSNYRSEAFNLKIGGSPDSNHKEGKAWDIKTKLPVKKVAEAALKAGFKGIGVYTHNGNNFVHVDIRATLTIWKDTSSGALVRVKSLASV